MAKPADVSIIIPAFNEEGAVERVIRGLMEQFPEVEMTVVNDGSTDNTGSIIDKTGANVIHHDRNLGYGASLQSGISLSTREYVLFCDADGQHSVEDVNRIIKECDGCDMAVGNRGNRSYSPMNRAPGKFILRKFANFLAGQKLPDLNSGLRIIKKEVLLKYIHLMPDGFSFSTTSTFALLKGKYRIKWVPITTLKREGKSAVQQWKHGPQTIMLMLRLTVLFEPLKVFMAVTGILFLLTLISLTIDLLLTAGKGIADTTVLLSISTLLVFMFGLSCDQISALRRELHEKD